MSFAILRRDVPRLPLIGTVPADLPVFQSTDGNRYYQTPAGNWYPSITTVLKAGDKPALEKWKAKLGPVESEAIAARSGRIGAKLHEMAEQYLLGNPITLKGMMPDDAWRFKKLVKFLDSIESVILTESTVYHPSKKVAGRLDVWAMWKGESCLIDFKTSLRPKNEKYTDHYYQQGTFYSSSLGYLYPLMPPVTKIVIVNLPLEDDMQILESDPFKWLPSLDTAIKTFYDRVPTPTDLPD